MPVSSKVAGRPETRVLVRWSTDLDIRLLLMIDSVCRAKRIPLPWEDIARAMGPKFSQGAIIQHLSKLRAKVLEADRETRQDGYEPPADVHGMERPRKSTAAGTSKTPNTGNALKRDGSMLEDDLGGTSSDEDWGKKKSAKKHKTKLSSAKTRIRGKKNEANEIPSRNTRGVVKDYRKLLDNDTADDVEIKEEVDQESEHDDDLDNVDQIKYDHVNATVKGDPDEATSEVSSTQADIPKSKISNIMPPPAPTFGLESLDQTQLNNPFTWNLPVTTPLMSNAQYPMGSLGYTAWPQTPTMLPNAMTQGPRHAFSSNMTQGPRQSLSSNSTMDFMNTNPMSGFNPMMNSAHDNQWMDDVFSQEMVGMDQLQANDAGETGENDYPNLDEDLSVDVKKDDDHDDDAMMGYFNNAAI